MEIGKMSLLGIAVTKEEKNKGALYVEYHECDRCGKEYRLYLRSPEAVEEVFQRLAKVLGNKKGEEDLCFNCQHGVIADQPMMPLSVG